MTEKVDAINTLLAHVTMLRSFAFEIDRSSGLYNLILILSENEYTSSVVTVHFKNIADLKIDFDAGGWVQLMMLRVDVGEEGFERKYIVEEHEHGIMSFRCSAIEVD